MPTPIEWCDETFNPWWGCERVSPACAHCYADTFARRIGMPDLWSEKDHRDEHGFRFFADPHWDEPLKWARTLPAKLGRRPRVFCASMADVFEDRPEISEHRSRLFYLIEQTPELDWLLLTKRPESVNAMVPWGDSWAPSDDWPRNVWIGVSIENARFTWRADVLREIPAAVRFISAEPLLGSLYDGRRDARTDEGRDGGGAGDPDGGHAARRADAQGDADPVPSVHRRGDSREAARTLDPASAVGRAPLDLSGIDWIIIGGESGPKARPFHLEHAREIINVALDTCTDGCECSDVPSDYFCGKRPAVFVKQLGAKPVDNRRGLMAEREPWPLAMRDRKGGDMDEWPADLRIREFPRTAVPA